MAIYYQLATPVIIGDLDSSIQVSNLRIAALSVNREAAKESAGVGVLSVILEDVVSGTRVVVVTYQDANALTLINKFFALNVNGSPLEQVILQKLASAADLSGKIKVPAGTVVTVS